MTPTITLHVVDGALAGKRFTFREKQRCLLGRSAACDIVLAGFEFLSVSRYHCLLDVNPPEIAVRDLCSRNGTFINGIRVWNEIEDSIAGQMRHGLNDGDELRVGDTTFRVEVEPSGVERNDQASAEAAPAVLG